MASPWLDDGDVQLYQGDALTVLRGLPAGVVQTCVTSPPYWGLRDYGADGQLGLEATPDEYVTRMVTLFGEVRRVLRDDGTLWLNLGDSFYSSTATQGRREAVSDTTALSRHGQNGRSPALDAQIPQTYRRDVSGLKPKDLVGIPWRVAFALQADGWYLRSDIIWSKPNPMPESVTDRPTKAHEYLFLLTKGPRYFYDADAIREDATYGDHARRSDPRYHAPGQAEHTGLRAHGLNGGGDTAGRNRRSVWTIPTEPFPEAHFATYPQALVTPCIQAGTSERGECIECGSPWARQVDRPVAPPEVFTETQKPQDGFVTGYHVNGEIRGAGQKLQDWRDANPPQTIGWEPTCSCRPAHVGRKHSALTRSQLVLDPFVGSGTTALVARKHGRRCIGIDLSSEYLQIAAKRTQQLSLLGLEAASTNAPPGAVA